MRDHGAASTARCRLPAWWGLAVLGRQQGAGNGGMHSPPAGTPRSGEHRSHGQSRADPPRHCSPPVFVGCSLQRPSKQHQGSFSKSPVDGTGGSSASFAGCCWDPARPWLCRGLRPRCDSAEAPDSFGAAQLTPYSRGLHSEIFLPFSFYFFSPAAQRVGAPRSH